MKFNFQYFLTIIGLFLFVSVSAQKLPYEYGQIVLNDGQALRGYVSIINSKKILFKTGPENSITKYKSKAIQEFSYDDKTYKSIQYKKKRFFMQVLVDGEISLYQRGLVPNSKQAFFLEKDEVITEIDITKRYDILTSMLEDASIFEAYNESFFEVAYDHNQFDLSELINHYNTEKASTSRGASSNNGTNPQKERLGFASANTNRSNHNNFNTILLPNTVRNNLVLRTEVIYNEIFNQLETDNWKKIETALGFLKPLANEIEEFYEEDIYSELITLARSKQKDKFKETFILFVSNGVQSLLQTADLQDSASMRKLLVRQAFVEFLSINEELRRSNPELANKIMSQFKNTFSNASNPQLFSTSVEKIQVSFKAI